MQRNLLLRAIPKAELALLEPACSLLECAPRQQLARPRVPTVAFILQGLCEARLRARTGVSAAVGLVGSEGLLGACHFFGTDADPLAARAAVRTTLVQIPWDAIAALGPAVPQLHAAVMRYSHLWTLQVAHTAVANAEGDIPKRVARWLLMLQDRLASDAIAITHDAMADSLHVRRAGVSIALQHFERQEIIENRRRFVRVLDRERLIQATGGLYGLPEREFQRLLVAA